MIGVLALQGGFAEHIQMLNKFGAESFEIRKREDLKDKHIDGLILPGGESTVIGKLLYDLDLFEPVKTLIERGTAVFGTCAGLILLSKNIADDDTVYFGAIDISAKRNAFGRQLGSFSINEGFADIGSVPMVFIRAPYIESKGSDVEVLAKINGHIVAARQNNVLVTAFHPELTDDSRVHEYFIENFVKKYNKKSSFNS